MIVAPGKLVLAGEYAVLRPGGLGLVMAVGPGIPASSRSLVCPGAGRLTLYSELIEGGVWRGRLEDGAWSLSPPQEARFVTAAVASLMEGRTRFDVELQVGLPGWLNAFPADVLEKPGLGGSSAAAVATICAVAAGLGVDPDPAILLPIALQAHRSAQGGRGSGIDVAASFFGGTLLYRKEVSGPSTEAVAWPEGWPLLPVFTGTGTPTLGRIHRFEAWCLREERLAEEWVLDSNNLVCALVEAIHRESYERFCSLISACRAHLLQLGTWTDIEMEGPDFARLAQGVGADGVFKQSGAGGGDCGLVFPRDPAYASTLGETLRREGLYPLALELRASAPGAAGK